jgi:adenylosuccinate lyase
MDRSELQKDIFVNAVTHGWWSTPRTFGDVIALIHSELSEALEEWRNGQDVNQIYYGEDGKPEGIPVEFADAVIRLMDAAEHYGFDLLGVVELKHQYNKQRPMRHGGKRL